MDIVDDGVQKRSNEQAAKIVVEDAIENDEGQATNIVLEHAGDSVDEHAADNVDEHAVDNADNVEGVDADNGSLQHFTDPEYEQNEEEHRDLTLRVVAQATYRKMKKGMEVLLERIILTQMILEVCPVMRNMKIHPQGTRKKAGSILLQTWRIPNLRLVIILKLFNRCIIGS